MSSLFQIMKKLVMLEGIQRNEGPLGLGPWGTLDPLTESLITPPSLAREVSVIQSENNNEKPNSIYTVAVRWLMSEEVQTSWLCRSPWDFFFFRKIQMQSESGNPNTQCIHQSEIHAQEKKKPKKTSYQTSNQVNKVILHTHRRLPNLTDRQ